MKIHKTVLKNLKKTSFCLSLSLLSPISLASDVNTRIIGGIDAASGAWPSAAALMFDTMGEDIQGCAGSLIEHGWVLTAAHCVQGIVPDSVILGRPNLNNSQVGERIGIKKIISHPSYNPNSLDNDIALIQLSHPSSQELGSLATPADIESFIQASTDTMTVIGWGVTNTATGDSSDTLKQVDVNYYRRYICNQPGWIVTEDGTDLTVINNQLCVGEAEGGQDSCQRDSGGPIFFRNDAGKKVQAGIVSYGAGCAEVNNPGVYTRVPNYIKWIKDQIPGIHIPGSFPWETIVAIGHRVNNLHEHLDSLELDLDLFVGSTWQEQLARRETKVTNLLFQAANHCWNGSPQEAITVLNTIHNTLNQNMTPSTKRSETKEKIMNELNYLWQIVHAEEF